MAMMESNQTAIQNRTCPECGATLVPARARCWLCGWKEGDPVIPRPAPQEPAKTNPYASPQTQSVDLNWTDTLTTVALFTTLIAVVGGTFWIAPGLATVLAIVCFPAALHACGRGRIERNKEARR